MVGPLADFGRDPFIRKGVEAGVRRIVIEADGAFQVASLFAQVLKDVCGRHDAQDVLLLVDDGKTANAVIDESLLQVGKRQFGTNGFHFAAA